MAGRPPGVSAGGGERACAGRRHTRRAHIPFLLRLFAMATIMVAAPLRRGKHQQRIRCRCKSDHRGRRTRGSGGARSGWRNSTMAKRRQLRQHWLLRLPQPTLKGAVTQRARRPSKRWTSRPRQAPGVSNGGFSTTDEASEALAERSRAVAHQRLNESETRPMRRFRKPGF